MMFKGLFLPEIGQLINFLKKTTKIYQNIKILYVIEMCHG